MSFIEVRDLRRSFQQGGEIIQVLKGINIQIDKGEFVCIMGASGSGKTTLLQILGGLDRSSSGSVSIAGTDITKLNQKKLALFRRQQLGFVFQQFNLISVLTAEENVALPLLIDHKAHKRSVKRAQELLNLVGLGERGGHRPGQLSGGQQQRVAIARALSTTPALLLADEPTGSLDSKTSTEIIHLMRRTCDEFSQTSIIVTHDPYVAAYADRIIMLEDGIIADDIPMQGHWMKRDIKQEIQRIQRRVG